MDTLIAVAADKYEIPRALVKAFVDVESGGNPWAVRYEPKFFEKYVKNAQITPKSPCSEATERSLRAHSFGLMQIMGQTAREVGFEGVFLTELLDPATNLDLCCRYLYQLVGRYFDKYSWSGVIAAYNAGSVRYQPGTKVFANQLYVDKVSARAGGAIR